MAFDKPQSRNEAILQNMLGANNELEPPKSRVEALLQELSGQMPEANPSEGTTTGTLERLKIGDDIYTVEGGGSGTSDYDALNNKPQIAGVTLSGDKSLADLGIASATAVSGILDGTDIDSFGDVETALGDKVDKVEGKGLSTNDYDDTEKAAVTAATTAIAGIKDGTTIDSFGDVESALALKQDATDSNLQTTADTIVGAINEHEGDIGSLKSGFTNLDNEVNGDATVYPYADVITIEDAVPANLADCSVKIEPVQDLHGYDKPWVGGAWKNICPPFSTQTISDVTLTWDASTGIAILNGTNNTGDNINFTTPCDGTVAGTEYWLNGAPSDASNSTYYLYVQTKSYTDQKSDRGSGVSFNYNSNGCRVFIRLAAGATANNVVFKPMICLNSETDKSFAPYTNLCPISGHTEASVQRDGKNILPSTLAIIKAANTTGTWADNVYSYNGVNYTVNTNTDGYVTSITASNAATTENTTAIYIPMPKDDKKYLFNGGADTDHNIIVWDATTNARAKEWDGTNNSGTSTGSTLLEVSNVSDHNLTVRCRISSGVAAGSKTFYPMVCPSFTTDPTFVPYAGKTYTIALGDTIYGGTVDFDSGVMTVTHGYADLGNFTYTKQTSENGTVFYTGFNAVNNAKYGNIDYVGTSLCSCFEYASAKTVSSYNKETINVGYDTSTRLRVCTDAFATLSESDFKTAVTGQKLCYELATPTTIQLTPQQIQLLKGTNTITASTGQISVTANGVSGAIGSVQEQVNGLAEDVAEIKPLNYSTTEQKTGQKWIDGKDIYQRSFDITFTAATTNWTLFDNSVSYDKLINVISVLINENGEVYPIQQDKDSSPRFHSYNNAIEYYTQLSSTLNYVITLQYTKSTT